MGMRMKRYQGGTIISFIVITAILVLVLAGGIFWVRQRSETARQGDDLASHQEDQSNDENLFPGGTGSGDNSTTQQKPDAEEKPDEHTTATNEEKPDEHTAQHDTKKETPANEPAGDAHPQSGSSDVTHSGVDGDDLPETGPTETAATILSIGALAYAATRYALSRRRRTVTR